jgi:hypothetical protein
MSQHHRYVGFIARRAEKPAMHDDLVLTGGKGVEDWIMPVLDPPAALAAAPLAAHGGGRRSEARLDTLERRFRQLAIW